MFISIINFFTKLFKKYIYSLVQLIMGKNYILKFIVIEEKLKLINLYEKLYANRYFGET